MFREQNPFLLKGLISFFFFFFRVNIFTPKKAKKDRKPRSYKELSKNKIFYAVKRIKEI